MNTEGTMTIEELIKEINEEREKARKKARNALWLDVFCATLGRLPDTNYAVRVADAALEKAIELGRI